MVHPTSKGSSRHRRSNDRSNTSKRPHHSTDENVQNSQGQKDRSNKHHRVGPLTNATRRDNNETVVSRPVSRKSLQVGERRSNTAQQVSSPAPLASVTEIPPTHIEVGELASNLAAHDETSKISESLNTALTLPSRSSIQFFTAKNIFPRVKFPTETELEWSTDKDSACHYTVSTYNIAPEKARDFWKSAKKVINAKLVMVRNDKNAALKRAFMGKLCMQLYVIFV